LWEIESAIDADAIEATLGAPDPDLIGGGLADFGDIDGDCFPPIRAFHGDFEA